MAVLKEKIIEKMQIHNLSISKLEQKAGLTIHSLRNVLKGRIKKPRFEFVVAVAEALECSPLDLMEISPMSKIIEEKSSLSNNKKVFLNYPDLMRACAYMIISLIEENKLTLSIGQYAEAVKALYCYSLSAEPKIPEHKFAKWLLEEEYIFSGKPQCLLNSAR